MWIHSSLYTQGFRWNEAAAWEVCICVYSGVCPSNANGMYVPVHTCSYYFFCMRSRTYFLSIPWASTRGQGMGNDSADSLHSSRASRRPQAVWREGGAHGSVPSQGLPESERPVFLAPRRAPVLGVTLTWASPRHWQHVKWVGGLRVCVGGWGPPYLNPLNSRVGIRMWP